MYAWQLRTYGAYNASVTEYVRLSEDVQKTQMFQMSAGQLRFKVGHLISIVGALRSNTRSLSWSNFRAFLRRRHVYCSMNKISTWDVNNNIGGAVFLLFLDGFTGATIAYKISS